MQLAWRELPNGEYEVHCSQIGYARSVYRILVSDKDVDKLTVMLEKDGSRPVGAGPSYDDVLNALSEIKKANAALHIRVDKLEARLAALRKALKDN